MVQSNLDLVRFDKRGGIATRAGRAYMALCYIGYDDRALAEATAEAAADYVPDPGVQWCAWHAVAVVTGHLDRCQCSPCYHKRGR